jgi:hypothetical protein
LSDPTEPVQPEPRRRPSTFGGLIYLVVVATTVVGLILVAVGSWRRGLVLVGIGFVFAAGMRLVINEGESGMLRVRGRWFDVTVLGVVGASLIALAITIPDQPGL